MKVRATFLFFALLGLQSCEEEPDPITPFEYNFNIINESAIDVDLYLKEDLDGLGSFFNETGFSLIGSVLSLDTMTMIVWSNLNYRLKFVENNKPIEQLFTEFQFSGPLPDSVDFTLIINDELLLEWDK